MKAVTSCCVLSLSETAFSLALIPGIALWTGCTPLKMHVLTNAYFSLTEEIEGVKTYSFFDNFLSFSGWCDVRGSSGVTVLIERLEWRVSKGL